MGVGGLSRRQLADVPLRIALKRVRGCQTSRDVLDFEQGSRQRFLDQCSLAGEKGLLETTKTKLFDSFSMGMTSLFGVFGGGMLVLKEMFVAEGTWWRAFHHLNLTWQRRSAHQLLVPMGQLQEPKQHCGVDQLAPDFSEYLACFGFNYFGPWPGPGWHSALRCVGEEDQDHSCAEQGPPELS